MRPRRPLLRGAMVGGAGYMAGKRAAKGQQREATQEERLSALEAQQSEAAPTQAEPAVSPSGGGTDLVEKLKELKSLADAGALSPAEFEAAKQKLLQG